MAKNQALAANMKRLRAGRSIGELRAEMAARGLKIGGGTLHRAIKGEAGNRLESLEKIAEFFDTTVDQLLQFEGVDDAYWPFSEELQKKVLTAPETTIQKLERLMRVELDMPEIEQKLLPAVNDREHSNSQAQPEADTGATEDGAGGWQEHQVPASNNRHGSRQRNQRPSRAKGRGSP